MSTNGDRLEEIDGHLPRLIPLAVACLSDFPLDSTLLENTNKLLAHVGISAKKIISLDELIRVRPTPLLYFLPSSSPLL